MVRLKKTPSTAMVAEIMKLRQFLDSISRYTENGFEWPKAMMDARNLDMLREQLEILEAKKRPLPEELARNYVPQEVFWIHNDSDDIIGMLKIRALLTPALLREGGHIGCGIVPQYRGKGYATEALQEAVRYCIKHHNLHDILLTVRSDNVASRRMVEKACGTLWDTIDSPNQTGIEICRYWIHC